MPDTTSSQPSLQLVGDQLPGAMDIEQQLRMGVDILPPGFDLVMEVGDAMTIGMALSLAAERR